MIILLFTVITAFETCRLMLFVFSPHYYFYATKQKKTALAIPAVISIAVANDAIEILPLIADKTIKYLPK